MTFNHFVIHKSVFDQRMVSSLSSPCIIKVTELFRDEHVHLVVAHLKTREPFKNIPKIRSEQLEHSKKLIHISEHYFTKCSKKHDFFCDVTFDTLPLKYMCIKSILRNLDYLHDIETVKVLKPLSMQTSEMVKLPKYVLRDIFNQSKSRYHLPEFNEQSVAITYDEIFQLFTEQDIIWYKKLVVWFQNDLYFAECLKTYRKHNFSHLIIVVIDFITADDNIVKMCLKCMNFESENGYYWRRYKLKFVYDDVFRYAVFMQDPINWCRACQQIPLFQLLTFSEFEYLYPCVLSDYYTYGKSKIIKMEYFEKGIKVKNNYVYARSSFGGTHHPYIF